MIPLVLPLRELDRSSVSSAGGKAANLGELLRAGFAVPEGFCLTTAAYRQVTAQPEFAPLAALLAALRPEEADQLSGVSATLRGLFERASLPKDMAKAIVAAARSLGGALAVRSSATAEDLPDASFAGQQESYLNVVGEAALLDAVRRCWGSLWTERAIAYRARNGIPQQSVALAVVVQKMVPAAVAGVLFTANPISGRRAEAVIEASFGLGEAVVAGLVSPDRYVVEKTSGVVRVREIATKARQVMPVPSGGTNLEEVKGEAAAQPALSDEQIAALVQLGKSIEACFGAPQDVEWALAEGQLCVLQSRPITSLFPVPPAAPEGDFRLYLSLNSLQGMLEPFTPLGASVFTAFVAAATGSPRQPSFLVTLAGRLYVDITAALRDNIGRRATGQLLREADPVAGKIVERLLTDERLAPGSPPPRWAALATFLKHWRAILSVLIRLVSFVISPKRARRQVETVLAPRVARVRALTYQPLPREQLPGLVATFVREGFAAIFIPRFMPMVAAGVLSYKVAEAIALRHGLDSKRLLEARQGLKGNKTTEMDLDLWALAEQTRADQASSDALHANVPANLAAFFHQGTLPEVLQQGMSGFLAAYGHRGIREIDVGMPRWSEDPSYLFSVLQLYATIHDSSSAPDRHFARQVETGELAVGVLVAEARRSSRGWLIAPLLGFFLRRFRRLGGLRETPKFYAVWLLQALRETFLNAGRQLADAGLLDRAENVFFLHLDELSAPREEGNLRRIAGARRHAYQLDLERRAPRLITSEGECLYGEAMVPEEGMLAGTGASPGIARGPVRIVLDPYQARLSPGDILVAPSTDPAWTPLFLTAGGLIMEAGGMMSHGSIVAREYGIPAVVGVVGAVARLRDGQEVELDGAAGLIRLLAVPPSP